MYLTGSEEILSTPTATNSYRSSPRTGSSFWEDLGTEELGRE